MNTHYYRASWDPLLKVITTATCAFIIILILNNPSFWVILILGAIIIIPPFYTIFGYSIEGENLVIHRPGWTKEFDLTRLQKAEVDNKAMKWSWRLLGNGGLFGYIGTFSNKRLGVYKLYATNRYKCVVLELENRKLVISPDSPNDFVKEVKELIRE